MSTFRCLVSSAAIAILLSAVTSFKTAQAQDLARPQLNLQVRRSALMEYWAAQQQEQIELARYRAPAQFGQYGQRFGAQPLLGYRTYGPQKPFAASPVTSSSSVAAASSYCTGPLGIECSPLDCDCDHYDCGY